jgi:BASS family bile acid:Na+ symporter
VAFAVGHDPAIRGAVVAILVFQIIGGGLIGDRVLLASIVFVVVMVVIGWFISVGGYPTRSATSIVQIGSNAGPSFAAVAIAFGNDPAILGAVVAILFFQIIGGGLIGSWMGRNREDPLAEAQDATEMVEGTTNG